MIRTSYLPVAISLLTSALVAFPAAAQSSPAAKELSFEVLSIKPVKRGASMQVGIPGPTPNGFTASAYLNQLVTFAYGPTDPTRTFDGMYYTEISNLPSWSVDDVYVFDARVSQGDLKAWQSQGPSRDLLRSALRAALRERFKLALHQEAARRTMFELVVAKRGPRLKPAAPGTILPVGVKLPSGGVSTVTGPGVTNGWDFYGATMADLANVLTGFVYQFDGPVRDRTGLTGRYDFHLARADSPGENMGSTVSVSDLGLELKRGTENRPVLVIDHLEKPTGN